MEVGESSRKEVSWIPTTPMKTTLQTPVPICVTGEGNPLNHTNFLKTSLGVSSHDCYGNSGAACVQSSPGEGINKKLQEQVESAARLTSNGSDSARTCVRPTFDAVSSGENMRFADLLALAEAASVQSTTIHPGSNNGVKNPFVPISRSQSDPLSNLTSTLPSHQNVCLQQTPVITINDNTEEPQGTYTGCCMKNISQFAPPTPDKAIGGESRLVAGMQINDVEDKNVPDTVLDNNKTSNNKELFEHVIESSVAAVSTPLKENHNPDKGSSRDFDLNQLPLPKQRRKKHRPKVITEGKPRGTRKPVTPKPVQSKENPTKRKYVRKKGLNKTSPTPPTEVTGEPTMPEPTKKSCRRSLNFKIGEAPRDENSVPRENATVDLDRGIDVVGEEILTAPSTYLSNINHLGADPKASSKKNYKRKGRVTTQEGHEKQERHSGQHDFNISSSGNLTTGLHMGVTKRKHSASTEHVDTSCMNLIGVHYNELDAYQTTYYWVQFPNVRKKRRSEKGLASNTSTTSVSPTKDVRLAAYPEEDASIHLNASNSNCFISCEYKAAEVPFTFEATDRDIHDKSQAFEGILSFCQGQTRPTKRRSRTPNRFREFATLTTTKNFNILPSHFTKQISNSDRQTFEDAQKPLTGIDALVAETSAVLTKKKRTTKKKTCTPGSSAHSSRYKMQQHHKFLLDSYHLSSAKTLDFAHQITWENVHIMDALAEKFRCLDIHKEIRDIASHEQNALVPYNQQNLKDKTNVHGDGTIISFEGTFDPIRKRRPRPKVDLDEETDKVWKLLMLDINSHGIDGTDEDKAKWWEEERRVFRGRADSFIARMHLVQGDRRFSQWKGSVVDSVIGVFLTQNVSDHLSSSAFMSLAARFPLKPTNQCKIHNEEGTSLVVSEPQVLMMEPNGNTKWDDKILNPSICYQSSVTQDIEHSEEKETVNSNDSSRTPGSIISLTDESNCRQLKTDEGNTKEHHSSTSRYTGALINQEGQGNSCYGGTGKESIDIVSSQCSGLSSQISGDFSIDQNPEKIGSCSDSNSELEDPSSIAKYNIYNNSTCFSELLEMAKSTTLHEVNSQRSKLPENCKKAYDLSNGSNVIQGSLEASITPSSEYTLKLTPNSGVPEVNCFDSFKAEAPSCGFSNNKDRNDMSKSSPQTRESGSQAVLLLSKSMPSKLLLQEQCNNMQQNFLHSSAQTQDLKEKTTELDSGDQNYALRNDTTEINATPMKPKGRRPAKEKKEQLNWDNLRVQAQVRAGKREKTANTLDSIDWDAVRCANVNEIADAIKERGMNNMLAERIKNFLNRLVEEHGGIDLEWLRDVPPDQAKEYLLSIRGLGLKSVECVRLLTLHHLAFPVDTNVGRIAVRLGWVPLQPLPESLQLHLLELYPVLESIQKYLWPRLCKLDQRTLYELHYQMITFGKVFCTKSKPNCNACPMRGECRHFASAFASARLALPGPEQRSIVSAAGNIRSDQNQSVIIGQLPLTLPEHKTQTEETQQEQLEAKSDQNQSVIIGQLPLHLPEHKIQTEGTRQKQLEAKSEISTCQPIIEEPATPETECTQALENDIEDAFYEDTCEIPTIKLNIEEFTLNLQNYMQGNMELQDEMSKALVALTPEAASIPAPKLKNVSRLRTEHCVYELPDSHLLLEGWDKREPDDPCKYLLAIWTPGETATSIQPPESRCSSQEYGQLCNEKECFSCNSIREANLQKVRGTILIPCRTAMRGSFPLNGTYFQVNEVFADHDSSLNPIDVPRSWIWNLNRRTVYFGTSIPSIFKGLSTPEIQQCFWRGHVCVRGFDRETRAPRPLMARLHFPASKLAKTKEKTSNE